MTPQGMDPSFLNNPMVVNALTNGSMQYMPNAQFMTPQAYGNFRTLPDMMYQQPVNQQAGFLKSSLLASGWGAAYGLGYNPAVNPALQRVEASRLSSDTMTSTLSAIGGTVADFALPGLAFKLGSGLKAIGGKGLLGMPLRFAGGMLGPAALIAQMALSNLVEGPQEKIANIRALQRISRGKIVTGGDIDSGMLTGFSTRAAKSLDDHLYRRSLYDGIYDADDYRRMMSEGVQAGLFDYTSSVDGYKKVLHNIRDNMATVMEVTGSDDFKDVMEQLKRLQDLGASQAQYKSILRSENMFARITGMSHGDLVSTYGAMGALEFNQRGLSQIQGSQVAMHNAALVTIGQRNGTLSNAYLAAHGGVSGMAQQMTGEDAQARAGYENVLLAALYDTKTGTIRKDATQYLNNMLRDKRNGYQKLADDAARNMLILSQDPTKVIDFNAKLPDLNQQLAEQTGLDINEQNLRVAIAAGRHIAYKRGMPSIDDRTAAVWGLKSMNFSDKDAQLKVDSYGEIQRHRNEEQQLDTLKEIAEYLKENNSLSKLWRGLVSPIKEMTAKYRDDYYLDDRLENTDKEAREASGMYKVRPYNTQMLTIATRERTRRNQAQQQQQEQTTQDAKGEKPVELNLPSKTFIAGAGFKVEEGSEIQQQIDKRANTVYKLGGGHGGKDNLVRIDCSGLVLNTIKPIIDATNAKLGQQYYSKKVQGIFASDTTAAGLMDRFVKAGGELSEWKKGETDFSKFSAGSLVWTQAKSGKVDHVGTIVEKDGKLYVYESTSRRDKSGRKVDGTRLTPIEDFRREVGGHRAFIGNLGQVNQITGGGLQLAEFNDTLDRTQQNQFTVGNGYYSTFVVKKADGSYAVMTRAEANANDNIAGKDHDVFTNKVSDVNRAANHLNSSFEENFKELMEKKYLDLFGGTHNITSLKAQLNRVNFEQDDDKVKEGITRALIAYAENRGLKGDALAKLKAQLDTDNVLQSHMYGLGVSFAGKGTKAYRDLHGAAASENSLARGAISILEDQLQKDLYGAGDIMFSQGGDAATALRKLNQKVMSDEGGKFSANKVVNTNMLLAARQATLGANTEKEKKQAKEFADNLAKALKFSGEQLTGYQQFLQGQNDGFLDPWVGKENAAEYIKLASQNTGGVNYSKLNSGVRENILDNIEKYNELVGLDEAQRAGFVLSQHSYKNGLTGRKYVKVNYDTLNSLKFKEGSEEEGIRETALKAAKETGAALMSGSTFRTLFEALEKQMSATGNKADSILNQNTSGIVAAAKDPNKMLDGVEKNTANTVKNLENLVYVESNKWFDARAQRIHEETGEVIDGRKPEQNSSQNKGA